MEEFWQYLLTVAIVLAFVASNRKKRAQAAAQQEPEPEPADTPFPPVRPQRIRPVTGPAQRTGRWQGSVPGAEPREEVATPPAHAPHPTPDSNPEPSAVMEDFDLRKAVVWSEVLRPKFQDEEGA